ncbi:hypothetical protein D9H83_22195 [Escherichia coli]|nr:hypothetical protein [Escherichia coli]
MSFSKAFCFTENKKHQHEPDSRQTWVKMLTVRFTLLSSGFSYTDTKCAFHAGKFSGNTPPLRFLLFGAGKAEE